MFYPARWASLEQVRVAQAASSAMSCGITMNCQSWAACTAAGGGPSTEATQVVPEDAATDMRADDTQAAAEAAGSDSVAETVVEDAEGTSAEVEASGTGPPAKTGPGAGANGKAKPVAGGAAGAGQSAAAPVKKQEPGPPQEWELMDIPFEWRPRVLVKVRPPPDCQHPFASHLHLLPCSERAQGPLISGSSRFLSTRTPPCPRCNQRHEASNAAAAWATWWMLCCSSLLLFAHITWAIAARSGCC